jgi:hypothetical protein
MEVSEPFTLDDYYTIEGGSARTYVSKAIPAALASRVLKGYLWIETVDANVRVSVFWAHSADGINWYKESTALIDTGAGADAARGMYVGDSGTTIFGAFARFQLKVEERGAGTSTLTGQMRLHVVWKPF